MLPLFILSYCDLTLVPIGGHIILDVLVHPGVLVPLTEVLVLQHFIEVLVLLLNTVHRCERRLDRF